MKKLILSLLFIPCSAFSAPYWNVVPSTATAMATATLSGNFIMYPSTTSNTAGVSISGNGAAAFVINTLVVDAINNRVGIGTATPETTLDVNGASTYRGTMKLTQGSERANFIMDSTNYDVIQFKISGGDVGRIQYASGQLSIANVANGPLLFQTNNTERVRILAGGNVGIGTTAPDEKLHVVGNVKIATAGNGLIFPDGTKQTSAAASTLDSANITTRQTVLSGSIDASGYADFVAAGSGLNAEIQANTDEPLVFAFANGYGAYGGADYIQTVVSTITVSVPASSTTYLYVTRDSSMSVTGHYTPEAPAYGYSHPSCVPGKFSFLIPQMKMYSCAGGVWTSTAAVFVGQVTTGASAVTSATTYALRGEYDSGWFAISGGGLYNKAHNIGTVPLITQSWGATDANGTNMGNWMYWMTMVHGSGGAWIVNNTRNSVGFLTDAPPRISTNTSPYYASASHVRLYLKRGW